MTSKEAQSWFEALAAEVDVLLMVDDQYTILRSSDNPGPILGRKKNHILNSPLSDSFPLLAGALKGLEQYPATIIIPATTTNQFPKTIEVHCSKILDNNQTHYGLAIHQIQQEKDLQKQIAHLKLEFDSVFTMAVDAIIIINQRGIIQKVNPATTTHFGYSRSEMIGKNVSMLMPTPHQQQHDSYIDNYIKSGKAKIIGIGRKVEGLRKDGKTFPMRLAVNEVKLNGYNFFTGIIQDISKEKAAEDKIKKLNAGLEDKIANRTEELSRSVSKLLSTNKKMGQILLQKESVTNALRQSQVELKESLRKEKSLGDLKTRFVTTASHEFRTPLSSILSSAEIIQLLLNKNEPEKIKQHLTRIIKSVEGLTSILEEFLSMSKLEEGLQAVSIQEYELMSIVRESIDLFEPTLKKGQIIELHPKQTEYNIFTDKKILQQILSNLFSNASKYSSNKSVIICNLERQQSEIQLSVIDRGMGIPKDDMPHLFSRFFRAKNAINLPGTGLGLNIISRFIKLINGKITVDSTLGEGSTFTITLPLKIELS